MAIEALRIAAKESKFLKFILGGFIFLAVGGLVFTDVGGYFTGGARGTTVAKVGDTTIELREFDYGLRQFIQEMGLTTEDAYTSGVTNAYLHGRIETILKLQSAQDMDISVSNAQVAKNLKSIFGQNATKEQIETALRSRGMSEKEMARTIRGDVMTKQISAMPKAITDYVPASLSAAQSRIASQQRSGVIYTLNTSDIAKDIEISKLDIQNYYDANGQEFTLAEERSFQIGTMNIDMIRSNLPKITQDDVRAEYNNRINDFAIPEKRSIIQVNVKDVEQAQSIYELAMDGNTSLKSALKTVTEGDNGYRDEADFDQSSLPVELSDPAFNTNVKKGDVLPPVKTLLGYVIMQVTNIAPETVKSFKSVKVDLEKDMKDAALYDALYNKMVDTEDMLDNGVGFEEISTKTGLKLKTIKSTTHNELNNADADLSKIIESDPSIANELFSLAQDGATYPLEIDDDTYVVIGIQSITQSSTLPLNDVSADIKKTLRAQRQEQIATAEMDKAIAELNSKATSWDDFSKTHKTTSKTFKNIARNNDKYNADLIFGLGKNDYAYDSRNPDKIKIYTITDINFKGKSDDKDLHGKTAEKQKNIIDTLLSQFWRDDITVTINDRLLQQTYNPNATE